MGKFIEYHLLDSNIHRLKWLDHKRDAIYEFVDITKGILEGFEPNTTALILQDFQDTAVPSFKLLMDAMAKSGSRKDITLRVAYLGSDSSLELIVNNLAIVKAINGNRNFFKPDEEQEAIDWLLSV